LGHRSKTKKYGNNNQPAGLKQNHSGIQNADNANGIKIKLKEGSQARRMGWI
jgi:hypothetical protein